MKTDQYVHEYMEMNIDMDADVDVDVDVDMNMDKRRAWPCLWVWTYSTCSHVPTFRG